LADQRVAQVFEFLRDIIHLLCVAGGCQRLLEQQRCAGPVARRERLAGLTDHFLHGVMRISKLGSFSIPPSNLSVVPGSTLAINSKANRRARG